MEKSRMATKKELQLLKDYAKMNVTGGNMKLTKLTARQKSIINAMKYLAKNNKNMKFVTYNEKKGWHYRLYETKIDITLEKFDKLIGCITVDKVA